MSLSVVSYLLLITRGSDKVSKIWTIWKYALGGFSDDKTEPYDDYVALLRTVIVGVNFLTCFFIMANVIHNW